MDVNTGNLYPFEEGEDINGARARLRSNDLERVGPRESDLLLHGDLKDAGLIDLAVRAARGEWNDYFGKHAMPQHHLRDTLQGRLRRAEKNGDTDKAAEITTIMLAIVAGKYDGTKGEADEWAAAQDGEVERVFEDPEVQDAIAKLKVAMESEQGKARIAEIEKQYVRDVLS